MMLSLLLSLTIFISLPAEAKGPATNSKIEFCKATMTRDGQIFRLGHSSFVEGESTRDGKTIFPTSSTFNPPITHIYDFTPDKIALFWIGCVYNSESVTFIDYVEIKTKPVRCVEIMRPGHANQIQSLTCETKKVSP